MRIYILVLLFLSSSLFAMSNKDLSKQAQKLVSAPHSILTEKDLDIVNDSPALLESANKKYDLSSINMAPEFLEEAKKQRQTIHHNDQEILYVFVTRGMPFTELQDMFNEVKDHPNAVVVFRGVYGDETIAEGITEIRKYVNDLGDYEPTIELDPNKFEKLSVIDAPTMVLMKNDKVLARVRGLYSPQWLLEQYHEEGRTGDLGLYGETTLVSEPSLIDRMKHEVAKIDWDAQKKDAIETYWDDKQYTSMPSSLSDTTRKLDPTFVVTADVNTPDGTLIARAGEKINPLKLRRFDAILFVFNPTKAHEVSFVKKQLKKLPENQQTMLIATKFEDGWDQIEHLEHDFGQAVFLLDEFMKTRFALRSTPSKIHADKSHFFVDEYLVKR